MTGKDEDNNSCSVNVIKTPDIDYTPDSRGMGYEIFNALTNNKNAVAQIDGITGEEDTHAYLLKRSIRTALEMSNKGISSNDVVTLCTHNHLNSAVPFIASMFLGAKVASLDPSLSLSDSVYLLKQVKPKMVFVSAEAEDLIGKALDEANVLADIVVFGPTTNNFSFDIFLKPHPKENGFEPTKKSLEDTAVIFFSSGTSGLPKGICASHYGILSQVANIINLSGSLATILTYSSFYWCSSVFNLMNTIKLGTRRIILPRMDPSETWDLIKKYKATYLVLTPTQTLNMIDCRPAADEDTSSLVCLALGGENVSVQKINQIKSAFPNTTVVSCYGQTELCGMITCFNFNSKRDMQLLQNNPNSIGLPLPGILYKVVDPETEQALGPNEPGELRLKSKFLMNGYYEMDSSSVFDSQGWFKTGDLVYYDSNNCFFFVDRSKEMLRYQGWFVTPAFLEGILQSHPAVLNSIVIGIPHERDGDHPLAVVVLAKSYDHVTPKEIEDFVEKRVHERQRLRGGVKTVVQIPTTPSGKIKRAFIRDMILRGEL